MKTDKKDLRKQFQKWRKDNKLTYPKIVSRVNARAGREVLKQPTLDMAVYRGSQFSALLSPFVKAEFPDCPLVRD